MFDQVGATDVSFVLGEDVSVVREDGAEFAELADSVREELPGGFLRELRDISVGPQPTSLFEVPAGWKVKNAN